MVAAIVCTPLQDSSTSNSTYRIFVYTRCFYRLSWFNDSYLRNWIHGVLQTCSVLSIFWEQKILVDRFIVDVKRTPLRLSSPRLNPG